MNRDPLFREAVLSVVLVAVLGMCKPAPAVVVYGPFGPGGTLNAYEYVPASATWDQSRVNAYGMSFGGVAGHLVTIGGANENALVDGTIPGNAWIGQTDATQPSTLDGFDPTTLGASELGDTSGNAYPPGGNRGDGWVWVTGEPTVYRNWGGGEPNDSSGEDAAHIRADGAWNDHNAGSTIGADQTDQNYAMVVEYDVGMASDPVPAGWTSADIGGPEPGSTDYVAGSGTWVVSGGGGDIWGNSDQFRYVYQPATGDFAAIARVVAQGDTNGWAKAGIMARDGTDADAMHVHTSATPDNGITQQWRDSAGGGSAWPGARLAGSPNGDGSPYWIALWREGNDVHSAWAPDADGTPFLWRAEQVHASNLPADVLLGLSVTAHDPAPELSTVNFDHVDLSAAAPVVTQVELVSFRVENDDANTVHLSLSDTTAGPAMTPHQWTNAGVLGFPVNTPMYIHIDGEEFGGGQWDASYFKAPWDYAWAETGNRFIATNGDATKQPGRALWNASTVSWDDPTYQPWDPNTSPNPPSTGYGSAGGNFPPGTERIWKTAGAGDNEHVYFSTQATLQAQPMDPLPAGLVGEDINTSGGGSGVVPGTGQIMLDGDGGDIWGTSDAFHFAHTAQSGDFTAVTRLVWLENTDGWAKAGLMARDGTAADAMHVNTSATPSNAIQQQWRDATGGDSGGSAAALSGSPNAASAGATPFWVMLQRSGNTFTSRWAPDMNGEPLFWSTAATHDSPGMPSNVELGLHLTSHNGGRVATAIFDNLDFQYTMPAQEAPPAPWVSEDIGGPAQTGSTIYMPDDGRFVVQGGGTDIWGNSDQFHYLHQSQSGDFVAVARLLFQQNTDGWAKAGIMARDSTAADAMHVNTSATPGNGVHQQWRDATGGGSGDAGIGGSPSSGAAPYWVLLERRGNEFISRWGPDDGTGQPAYFGTARHFTAASMPSALELGLSVTSHNGGALSAAAFDGVDLNYALPGPPAGFTSTDIGPDVGNNPLPGSAEYYANTGTIVVEGGGNDIWGDADAFHFLHQLRDGDFTAVVRMISQENTDGWAKAGIMAREDTTAGARHVNVSGTPGNQIKLQGRPTTAGSSSDQFNISMAGAPNTTEDASNPAWLILRRRGDQFTAHWAPDDNGSPGLWTGEVSNTVALNSSLELGLHTTAHNAGRRSTAVFDNLMIGDWEVRGSLAALPGNKLGGTAFAEDLDNPGQTLGPVSWTIEELTYAPGLQSEWYFNGRYVFSGAHEDYVLADIDWANGDYPAETPYTGDMSDYAVRITGQIYAPESRDYTFHDYNDDDALLVIDGQTLIDDPDWTDRSGASGSGGADGTVFLEEGWHDLLFQQGEGGGGDNARLAWDLTGSLETVAPEYFRYAADSQLLAEGEGNVGDLQGPGQFDDLYLDDFAAVGETVSLRLTVNYLGELHQATADLTSSAAVPEPSTCTLLVLGGLGLLFRRRRSHG